jgi:crcB protein
LKKCLYIGFAGMLGAMLRVYIKSQQITCFYNALPFNTILINVTGSFVIGIVLFYSLKIKQIREHWKLALTTGFLGGFTTFSTFCKEAVLLINKKMYFNAGLYISISICLGILSIMVAFLLINFFNRVKRKN